MIYTIEECVPSDVGVLAEVYLPTSSIAPPTENYHGACSREELLLMLNATVLWIFSRHDPGFRKEKHELEAVNSTTDEIAAYAVRIHLSYAYNSLEDAKLCRRSPLSSISKECVICR